MKTTTFALLYTLPSLDEVNERLRSETEGAVVHFVGNVRAGHQEKRVTHLEFEAYEPMAVSELEKIAERLFEKYSIHHVLLYHRLGHVHPSETAVIAAVAAAHRHDAFLAVTELMDDLKKYVPIWKKEVYADGHVWVSTHP